MNKKNALPVWREGRFYGRSWKKSIQNERMGDAALSAFFREGGRYEDEMIGRPSGIACFVLHGAVIFASLQPFLIPICVMLSLCIYGETLRGTNHVPFL